MAHLVGVIEALGGLDTDMQDISRHVCKVAGVGLHKNLYQSIRPNNESPTAGMTQLTGQIYMR